MGVSLYSSLHFCKYLKFFIKLKISVYKIPPKGLLMLSSKGVESNCKAGHLALGQKMRNIHSVIQKRKAK